MNGANLQDMTTTKLGAFVAERRAGLGLTAEQLEEKAGIGAGTVTRIESGQTKNPKPPTMVGLARALGVSVEDLDHARVGVAPSRRVEPDDLYPSRPQAIELMRGKLDEETLRALAQERLRDDVDPGLEAWIARAIELQRLRSAIPVGVQETRIAPKTSTQSLLEATKKARKNR